MFGLFKQRAQSPRGFVFGDNVKVRAFAAAEVSRTLAQWTWDDGFSNQSIANSLATIRSRSRDMAKNSEYYARWLDLFVTNVVGEGFTLKAVPAVSPSDPSVNEDLARAIQYHWWKWASSPRMVDETGRKSFARVCRLVAENWARDGEAFILKVRDAANAYGFSLRVVRPDAIDETVNGVRTGERYIIRNGVEIDTVTLKPTAYYFRAAAEDTSAATILGKPSVRIPASEVLHVFTQHDECQTRGIPLGHSVLKKLKMLDEFNIAELVAANDEANTIGVFHCDRGEEADIQALNEDQEASGVLCQESSKGQKFVLPQGWNYDVHTPQHPNREVSAFKASMLRDIASGLNVEYANFANDWGGVSFSSVRAGTLSERAHWEILQADLVEMFVTPVYLDWLESFATSDAGRKLGLTRGSIGYVGEHEFRGRTWGWVDPMKDVQASILAVQQGWKTNEEIAASYGSDFLENCAKLKIENEAKTAAGVLTAGPSLGEEEKDEES